MAKQYTVSGQVRFINTVVGALNKVGLGGRATYTLTTVGRKTGASRSTPVTLAAHDGVRYLVSPYGEVGWVHNMRASGTGTLSRRGRKEQVTVSEVAADEAGPVLKRYVEKIKIVRPYFDAGAGDDVGAFVAEAHRHPVFRIVE